MRNGWPEEDFTIGRRDARRSVSSENKCFSSFWRNFWDVSIYSSTIFSRWALSSAIAPPAGRVFPTTQTERLLLFRVRDFAVQGARRKTRRSLTNVGL